jgi:hypothetical protein
MIKYIGMADKYWPNSRLTKHISRPGGTILDFEKSTIGRVFVGITPTIHVSPRSRPCLGFSPLHNST